MKKMLYLAMLVCSLNAMDESIVNDVDSVVRGHVIVKYGDKEYLYSYRVPEENENFLIETNGCDLDSEREHAYLSGMCDVLRDLGYGMLDLRRLEQNIAEVHGHEESHFKHTWNPCDSEQKVRETVPVSLVFSSSRKGIASPCLVPILPNGHTLELLSNLKNRTAAHPFIASILSALGKDNKHYVALSFLEKAVLAELQEESGE